jgi:hypothetical protein
MCLGKVEGKGKEGCVHTAVPLLAGPQSYIKHVSIFHFYHHTFQSIQSPIYSICNNLVLKLENKLVTKKGGNVYSMDHIYSSNAYLQLCISHWP